MLIAVGATGLLTLTSGGRAMLASTVSGLASADGRTVKIANVDGLWGGRLTIGHVVVEDADGPWLVVRDIAVDWSPSALLSRTFRAERVHAGRIEVARLPIPAPPREEPAPSGGLALPVDMEVASIDLPRIALGGAIAGEIARISANGSAIAKGSPLAVETDLTIARTDGKAGEVVARVAFVPDQNRLDVDVTGTEPGGGILSNLMQLEGNPPIGFSLKGAGALDDWTGKGELSIAGLTVTRLTAIHRLSEEGRRIEAKGDGDFSAFLPLALRPLAEGSTEFDIAAVQGTEGAITIDRADLRSKAIRATASGRYDPAGASDLSIAASARGQPVALSFGEGGGASNLALRGATARIRSEGGRPAIDARADLASVRSGAVRIDGLEATVVSEGFDIATRTGPLKLEASAAAIDSGNPTLAPLLAGPVTVKVEGTLGSDAFAIETANVAGKALSAAASGEVALSGGAVAIDMQADVAAAALPEAARAPLGERVALKARIERTADGAVAVEGIDLASGPLSITGNTSLDDGQLTAALTGAYADLSLLSTAAQGEASFSLDASGALATPDIVLKLSSNRIVSGDRAVTGLSVEASGRADAANPAADLKVSGDVEGQPLTASGRLSTEGGTRRIEGLSFALGDNRISGDLALDAAFRPIGELTLDLPQLGPLAALALQEIEGAARGVMRFAVDGTVPTVTADIGVPTLKRGDLAAEAIDVQAVVSDYLVAPAVSGTVRATRIAQGSTVVSAVNVALSRDGEWTGFDGGATVAGIPATAKGRARYAAGAATIELASAEATYRGLPVRVSRLATISFVDGTVRLAGLEAAVSGGRVTVDGTAGSTLALDARLASVPASVVNAFAPGLGAEGAISGTAKVTGAASNPAVAFDLDWGNAATSQTRAAGFGALSLSSSGTFAGGSLTFDARAADAAGFNLSGGGRVVMGGGPSLDLSFTGQAPFAFLSRRLAQQGLALNGAATIDVRVRGTAARPDVSGTVRTSGARFVDARSGIAVQDLAVDIALSGQTATVRSMTGTLSSGGAISASGTIGIDAAAGFPADLSVRVSDGRYADGRTVTASFSGDITIKGPLASAPVLGGSINLGRTVITIPEKLPGSLAQIDVRHRNASTAVERQAQALRPATASGGEGGLSLDLAISAPQQIFVRGRGLDAELGGTLRLSGPSSAPQAVGTFTLRRGRLAILGRRLDFTNGSIGFGGSLVPRLDFAATSSAGSSAVTVRVSGPANDPAFAFSSSPTLPQDEILAQLIFGRSLSNLSPLQIAQLAEAAAQLTGIGGSTSLFDSIRDRLGVDDLDIKTDEATGDTSVSVGKYLNDRTYVGIEKGSSSGSGKATINLDIGRGVKLRGEAAEDGKAKGGIFFEREY